MPAGSQLYEPHAVARADRYLVTATQYAGYQRDGYLIVRSLVARAEALRLRRHAMAILHGEVKLPGSEFLAHGATTQRISPERDRLHMLHRIDATCEQFLLHPRILDVVEALVGPDVLALQTMQFYNRPLGAGSGGQGGQGWHQDSKYIATFPDTLIGTWLALDDIDEENGCLWVVPQSNHQPVFPEVTADGSPNHANVHATGAFDIEPVSVTPVPVVPACGLSRPAPRTVPPLSRIVITRGVVRLGAGRRRPTWTTVPTHCRAWRAPTESIPGSRAAWRPATSSFSTRTSCTAPTPTPPRIDGGVRSYRTTVTRGAGCRGITDRHGRATQQTPSTYLREAQRIWNSRCQLSEPRVLRLTTISARHQRMVPHHSQRTALPSCDA